MQKRFAHHILIAIFLGVTLLGFWSCDNEKPEDKTFNQNELLTNLARNIIVPRYQSFQSRLAILQTAVTDFEAQPSTATLETVRQESQSAYLLWQECSAFEFGPAGDRALRSNVNTFPADNDKIQQNISGGSYDLATASNLDAKGLPALDYLLFGLASDASGTVQAFTDPNDGQARMDYLSAVVADLKTMTDEVVAAWTSGYDATFIAAEGTDVGSSLGQFVNQFNFDYEILKKPKLGIPLGKQTLGTPLPENVEALYSGQSLDLMTAQFAALSDLYHGRSNADVDGYGLHEALEALEATYNGGSLAEAISAQIETVRTALAAIPGPLSETVVDDPAAANAAYTEVQRLVVFFKTDMTSALGVLITYVDNDGD